MVDKVKQFIKRNQMLAKGDRVVVGISGGADSVALLHILKQLADDLEIEIFGAHLNHGLRGEAAQEDAFFTKKLCEAWNIPFFLKGVDVRAISKKIKKSEEETGRILRYDFFDEVLGKVQGTKIATAHHKNDQAETILHHIIRGSGLNGLAGIRPVIGGKLIRPLLNVTRSEIEEYLSINNIDYVVDATNNDYDYMRNRIRHELIPYIEKSYNPQIVDSLARLADILGEENDYIEESSFKVYSEYAVESENYISIDLNIFLDQHDAVKKRLIRIALSRLKGDLNGIGYVHINDVFRIAHQTRTGAYVNLPASIVVKKGYNGLEFLKINANSKEEAAEFTSKGLNVVHNHNRGFFYRLDVPGHILIKELGMDVEAQQLARGEDLIFTTNCAYIDRQRIDGDLKIRNRLPGDRFKPLGTNGTKKLKDFFIDNKVPREERDSIPLLTDDNNIIWVIGFQPNDDYKITTKTKDIIKIIYYKK